MLNGDLTALLLEEFQGARRPKRGPLSGFTMSTVEPGAPGESERDWLRRTAFVGVNKASGFAEGLRTAADRHSSGAEGPQVSTSALTRRDGFLPRADDPVGGRLPHRRAHCRRAPGGCRSFRYRTGGGSATATLTRVKGEDLADGSWAWRIDAGRGDAPAYVKWFRHGPFLTEVRVGTLGVRAGEDVSVATLDAAARATYDHIRENAS